MTEVDLDVLIVDSLAAADLLPILKENIAAEAHVMTDEAAYYQRLGKHFASHRFTRHSAGQYVDYADPIIHTNTIEGAFSIFKRGMKGVYRLREEAPAPLRCRV